MYKRNVCNACGKLYSTPFNLRRHLEEVHEKGQAIEEDTGISNTEMYTCEVCEKTYQTPLNLRRHLDLMHGSDHVVEDMTDEETDVSDTAMDTRSTISDSEETMVHGSDDVVENMSDGETDESGSAMDTRSTISDSEEDEMHEEDINDDVTSESSYSTTDTEDSSDEESNTCDRFGQQYKRRILSSVANMLRIQQHVPFLKKLATPHYEYYIFI